ncbi:TWiK family of potassium channels protein 9-like [Uloborus diversus]|nr:TWiK family of potassium channels protein 9-like [Uloborus diversus]
MSVAWNKMPYIVYQGRAKKSPEKVSGETDVEKIGSKDADDTKRKHDADSKEKEKNKKGSEKVETAKEEPEESEEQTEAQIIQEEEETDEFNLPVSLAVILLITYMMLGAFIFTLWEDWTFFESFYFVFVSMSTIGFGDYVPDHPMYMMATFIYLLFGLALTSMCINVVQEKLSAIFQMAKMRIGTTVGLDANILMEDDVMSDKSDTPDSKRRGSSLKSRRGSKAPPAMSQDKDEDEYKPSDSPHSKENGVKDEPIMSTDI